MHDYMNDRVDFPLIADASGSLAFAGASPSNECRATFFFGDFLDASLSEEC